MECLHVHLGWSSCRVVKVPGEVIEVNIGKVGLQISTAEIENVGRDEAANTH